MPIFKLAHSLDKYKDQTKLCSDKLIIGRSTYQVKPKSNLNTLPPDLNPAIAAKQESDDAFVFFGKDSPFSNFNFAPTQINGQTYVCTEQFIQHEFAMKFNNQEIASKIMQTNNPYTMKQLAREVNADIKLWHELASEIIKTALMNKFAQHEIHHAALKATGSKHIGEATTDKFWGIGISLSDQRNTDTSSWSGKKT